ncbi:MAG: 4,4'-diaponeurosporenoate glycosyltransferase [Verrucomicrobiales bacterium]|jgi:4,4'-diaponeurosporenoate glycosyltransferase
MEWLIWLFLGVSALSWLCGWIVFGRLRGVPPLKAGEPAPRIKLSVVIPARNEEANLRRLLPSLLQQDWAPHEIILVDDQSEDETASIAWELGARVLLGAPVPDGWKGKPWACAQGAKAASGDWILFLDADTVLEFNALRRIAALTKEPGAAHSICPYHEVEKPYEQLSAFFNVIMLVGSNAFSLKGENAKATGLFGQALLVSRTQYDAVGGHEAVKSEVLENFHLSRHLSSAGYACRSYLGYGLISMRMFPEGYRGLVAGWSKGFVSGAANTARSALIWISLWLSGLIMSVVALTFLPFVSSATGVAIGCFYGACALQCVYLFKRAGTFWIATGLLYPIGLIFYQTVFFQALRRVKRGGTVQWKGRDVC